MKNIRQLFGTDGIRGVANLELTPELALKVGKAGARYLCSDSQNKQILIGRDTRPSGDFISSAINAGILSSGIDVLDAGIITTPAVALLVKLLDLDGGIVVSASHNPVEDNGIKFFSKGGQKLTDFQEKAIEDFILNKKSDRPENMISGAATGRYRELKNAYELYLDYMDSCFDFDLSGLKIAIDCANGAASLLGPKVFERFGAKIFSNNTDVSGININKDCGATHPAFISGVVKDIKADIGFTYDGDADRVLVCDSNGRILDGDILIGFCAIDMAKRKTLKNNCVVTTIMANMGFDRTMEKNGITVYKTDVGDRYVLEKMNETGCILGGEQSGHIIFKNISPTGDGLLSSMEFLNVLVKNNYRPEEIYGLIPKFPQVLKNIRVKDKKALLDNDHISAKIMEVKDRLANRGRVVVRPSGTEPLVRVMVEAETIQMVNDSIEEIVNFISEQEK